MFASTADKQKTSFLEQTKAARAERAHEKRRDAAIVVIQSRCRGLAARKLYRRRVLDDFDAFTTAAIQPNATTNRDVTLRPALDVYPLASRFLKRIRPANADDAERLERLCRYLIASLDADTARLSYIGVALQKEHSLSWIRHIKLLLYHCCECMRTLRPEHPTDSVSLALFLHTLVAFTGTGQWTLLRSNKQLGAALRAGMQQLCNNVMGGLVQKGFYQTLRQVLLRGTCRTQVVLLKPISLAALLQLATRPLVAGSFSDNLLSMFLVQVLSVPALVHHAQEMAPDALQQLQQLDVLPKSLALLNEAQSIKIITNSMQGTQSLALVANLVQLFHLDTVQRAKEPTTDASEATHGQQNAHFTCVCTSLLLAIPNTVGTKGGTVTQWHTLLGWFAPAPDAPQNENLALIKAQLYLLWSGRVLHRLMGDRLKRMAVGYAGIEFPSMQPVSTNVFKRALERSTKSFEQAMGGGSSSSASAKNSTTEGSLKMPSSSAQAGGGGATVARQWRRVGDEDVRLVSLVCSLYHVALTTLAQLKLDILSGLCYNDTLLHDMFLLLASLGPNCGLRALLELLAGQQASEPMKCEPQLLMLQLFCNMMTHYVTILDDIEMYEQQEPFKLGDYTGLSYFLNNFLYRAIQDALFGPPYDPLPPILSAVHTLLMCLYRRDCRRPFAPTNHWLIHELRPAHFIADLDKGKKAAEVQLVRQPHIIPHADRVKLFRLYVQNEKQLIGAAAGADATGHGGGHAVSSALITVHRGRIVEDGYRQLAMLPPAAMKGVIRVRFVNQQGLDEAGIDQDGVFKEFLEETIQRVFDPSLNLFKTTADQRLYPSPTSHVQENHLQLFEFVGLMLGKAVYEGIVVDVPFASFFLSQLLGQTSQALYSCMDELPSLDQELYRSLTFIKHYQGDVADLDLMFAVDEDQMGKIVTHELHPGGRTRPVTNDNKINYIHYSAYFRMHTQIREQTIAFIRGFRSIVNTDWLMMFSTPELQRLISGDTTPMDLKDLRKHTQYYGGFHDSHRVVGWLWDILAKDFTENERKLFLKFVTSCSKPPLLGFAHLEPPFSIRCVEVGDDEDTGDTIGSVIRGFFTIRKKDPLNRLPTSSTCFNLLKLPNYQKKSTLREKLRYAVSSNTGFELS